MKVAVEFEGERVGQVWAQANRHVPCMSISHSTVGRDGQTNGDFAPNACDRERIYTSIRGEGGHSAQCRVRPGLDRKPNRMGRDGKPHHCCSDFRAGRVRLYFLGLADHCAKNKDPKRLAGLDSSGQRHPDARHRQETALVDRPFFIAAG